MFVACLRKLVLPKYGFEGGPKARLQLNIFCVFLRLTWPMAKRLKLFGITYLVGKIKFKLLFQGSIR